MSEVMNVGVMNVGQSNIASATHNSINWCKTCITPHDLSIKLADLRSQIHVTCFTALSRISDLKYF